MNELQKKSLIYCFYLLIVYVAVLYFPEYFIWEFIFISLLQLIFWISYFNIKPNKTEIREGFKFLIIPLLFNLGSVLFVSVFFQFGVRVVFALAAIIANYYLMVALRRVFNLQDKSAIFQRNVIISISFLSIFFGTSAIFRYFVELSVSEFNYFSTFFVVSGVFTIFYLVSYFLGWQSGIDMKKFYPYNLVNALIGAEIAWVGAIWVVNYPTFGNTGKISLGGVPLPAIVLTVMFYFLWGIISQKVDKNLTRQVLTEYFLITIIFLLILISTARWLP